MGKKLTTETFIDRASTLYNNMYDYSHVVYVNINTPILVIDPVYGEFTIKPALHLYSNGTHPKRNPTRKMSTDEFIEKCRHVHGNIYDYSLVEYKGNKIKVCIIDPVHGEFWQKPNDHLNGFGNSVRYGNVKGTKESFEHKARKIHGELYDYSNVNYVNDKTEVCIIDPIHGEFWQRPNNHLNGEGHRSRAGKLYKYCYINILYDNNIPIALKYGIESVKGRRIKSQNSKSIFDIKNHSYYVFEDTQQCINAENLCKSKFSKILTYEEMNDGYTETADIRHLEDILAIFSSFGGVKC